MAERSLDRLKRLDDIADVDEQLTGADGLCNHAHRADMVIRWLLGKLKQTTYQSRPTAWRLLTKCIRLLQPTLLPSRFKAVNILALVIEAVQDDLIACIDDALTTLLAITTAPLSVEASLAARFFGVWAEHRLATALQIWELRRPPSDDEAFTEHCLGPAALLLTTSQDTRKRGYDGVQRSQSQQLERLIAKHVFMKPRAAFFKGTPLQTIEAPAAALPAILNVAIRCGSISSQRQMLQEVAWNDASFEALSKDQDAHTILAMLDVIKARSTLSLDALQKVVLAYGALDDSTKWDLIEKIVSMNPRVFSDAKLYQPLFNAMARESRMGRQMILPIMTSFAQDRRLPEFLDLWQQQVDHPIWTGLDDALETILEEYLTPHQILDLVKARLEALPETSIVTSAILRGIKNPETQDLIAPTVDQAYVELESMNTSAVGFWRLARRLLDIHLPRNSAQLAGSKLFKKASKQAYSSSDAALFAAKICEVSVEHAPDFLHKLIKKNPDNAAIVFISHPTLLGLVQESDYKLLKGPSLQETAINACPKYDRFVGQHADLKDLPTLELLIQYPDLRLTKEHSESLLKTDEVSIERLVLLENILSKSRNISPSLDDIWRFCSKASTMASAPLLNHLLAVIEALTKLHMQRATMKQDIVKTMCSKVTMKQSLRGLTTHARVLKAALKTSDKQETDLKLYNFILPRLDELQQQASSVYSLLNEESLAISSLLDLALVLPTTEKQSQELQRLAALILTKLTPVSNAGEPLAILHPAVRAYQVMCMADAKDSILLAHAASRSLDAPFTPTERAAIIKAYSEALSPDSSFSVLQSLLPQDTELTPSALIVAKVTLHSVQKSETASQSITPILLRIVTTARNSSSHTTKLALQCMDHVLQHQPYLVNQYTIEETLTAVKQLATYSKAEPLIFPELCHTLTALLKHHRARLNGRFHILLMVLQSLLGRLLAHGTVLGQQHAHAFARVLTLLCDPPRVKHRKAQDSLVDQTRRVRAHVGSFVPVILHSYCSLVLKASPREGMAEGLTPGLWAIMGAMEISDTDSIKILSSAMNNNERSVLRGVVEQWRASERWSGR